MPARVLRANSLWHFMGIGILDRRHDYPRIDESDSSSFVEPTAKFETQGSRSHYEDTMLGQNAKRGCYHDVVLPAMVLLREMGPGDRNYVLARGTTWRRPGGRLVSALLGQQLL
jgi:hypothetical protein